METADLVTFIKEILNGKLHFLCSVSMLQQNLTENLDNDLNKQVHERYWRGNYMETFNPGWNLNSLNRAEISSRLDSKHLFKITLQLHVKVSALYIELKFELDLANPRLNFNPGWKFQISHKIDIFPTGDENLILRTHEFLFYSPWAGA